MTAFSDDFNRANGPVGNGWTVPSSNVQVLNNELHASLGGWCVRSEFPDQPVQRARADVKMTGAQSANARIYVKANSSTTSRYQGQVTGTSPNMTATIYRYVSGAPTVLDSHSFSEAQGSYATLELVYDNGALTLLVNGTVRASATDNQLGAYYYSGIGLVNTNSYADNYYSDDLAAEALDVTPEPIVQQAVSQTLTFTGTGTSWTPGTPGSPEFTVDKGSLSNQTIDSPTHGTADYLPPQADDEAMFTDPSTSKTDIVPLSTGFQVSGGWEPSQAVQDYLENSAQQNDGDPGDIVSTKTPITPYGTGIEIQLGLARLYAWVNTMAGDVPTAPPDMSMLDTLWWILNGHGDVDEDHNVLGYAATAAVEATNATLALSAIRTDALYTFQSILDAIAAISPPDLSPILDVLAEIQTPADLNLGSIVSAIDDMRGLGLPTLADATSQLAAIRTPAALTLGTIRTDIAGTDALINGYAEDILAAIAAIPETDLSDVLAAIAAVRGADNVDLTQLHDQTNAAWLDLGADHDLIRSDIGAARGVDYRDLTNIYDAIMDLPQDQVSLTPVLNAITALSAQLSTVETTILAAIAALRPADYPLWPGAGNAHLGTPVSGTRELLINGPLDGLLIDVTAHPTEIEAWTNSGRKGLKWAGQITFVADVGYTEEIQFPGTDRRVVVPKSMLTAASALVHLRAGVQATVTPWIYVP